MTTGADEFVASDAIEPSLARITVYPVKSLDGVDRTRSSFAGQALEFDRAYALVDGDGEYVNGKRERAVHRLRSEFDLEQRQVTLSTPSRSRETFTLPTDDSGSTALTAWLSDHFGYDVSLRRDDSGGFPDDTSAAGPTVISTATLREVASWYPDIDPSEMRRRLRANLELDGVPAFWEDRLFADRERVVPFSIGDRTFTGVNPCQRCVVPTRHPDTGRETPGFRERFVTKRRETMPAWSGGDWFDHDFRLMVNTRVDPEETASVAVGSPVVVGEPRSA